MICDAWMIIHVSFMSREAKASGKRKSEGTHTKGEGKKSKAKQTTKKREIHTKTEQTRLGKEKTIVDMKAS